jgi:outer membrane protein assembly factor BamB
MWYARGNVVRFALITVALCADAASGWQVVPFDDDVTTQFVTAPTGKVVLGAERYLGSDGGDVVVALLDPDTGVVRWRHEISGAFGQGYDVVSSVAADPGGDVIVGSGLQDTGSAWSATVTKLAGTSGALIWQTTLDPAVANAEVDSVAIAAVEGGGDIVVLVAPRSGELQRFTVVRVEGTTGAVLWRRQVVAGDADPGGAALALDVAGDDVVVAGQLGASRRFAVVKLALGNGTEIWRYVNVSEDPPYGVFYAHAASVVRDTGGDVIAAGNIAPGIDAVKLSGTTGATLWRHRLCGKEDVAIRLPLLATQAGDVVLGRRGLEFPSDPPMCVAMISGDDGTDLWHHRFIGGSVNGLALERFGDVVAIGGSRGRFVAARLSASTGRRRWSRRLAGRRLQNAYASGVTLADDGDPIVAGIVPSPTSFRSLVAKLCRRTGSAGQCQR